MLQCLLSYSLRFSIAAPIFGVVLGKTVINPKLTKRFFNEQHWVSVFFYILIIILFIIIVCFILKSILKYLQKNGSTDSITCESVDPVGNEFFSTSYPFLTISYGLIDSKVEILWPWLLGVVVFFIILTNDTIVYNFLYKLSGYNLYRIRSVDKNMFIIITKQKKFAFIEKRLKVVKIDSYTYLDISNNT